MTDLLLGIFAGSFYFGGLWWTIKGLPETKNPRTRVALSFWFRVGLFFWLLSQLEVTGLLLFLVGFFGLRNVLVSRWS